MFSSIVFLFTKHEIFVHNLPLTRFFILTRESSSEMEFEEFEPRFKSAKTRFKLSAGLNLETFDTIESVTHDI